MVWNALAQNQINSITNLGNNFCIYTESDWINDTLIVVGTSAWKATIVKYLADGTIVDVDYIIDTVSNYSVGFWDRGLVANEDTIYHIMSKGNHTGVIAKMDRSGIHFISKEYGSVYYPDDDFCRFRDFEETRTGFIILDYGRKTDTDFDICIVKTDKNFNIESRRCYGDNSLEIPNDILVRDNSNRVFIGNGTNLDISDHYNGPGKGFYRAYIFETDQYGNLIWEWRSPSRSEAAFSGFLENDSTLVVAAGYGIESCSGPHPLDLCSFDWKGGCYKFNLKTQEKIWETSLSQGTPYSFRNSSYLDIIPSIENDGYVLCGAGYYPSYPGCAQIDTTLKCWNYPGVIAKVSNTGDSLWMRKYFGVTDIWESNILYDAEITPDSGYSFVGEAFNPWSGETQGQFGWLLMTDRYGCLVPGCHLISDVKDTGIENSAFECAIKLFPNPTSDLVNILITETLSSDATLHLFDFSGREIDKWQNFEKGATYMIPIHNIPSGEYLMTMTEGNKVLCSEVLLIK